MTILTSDSLLACDNVCCLDSEFRRTIPLLQSLLDNSLIAHLACLQNLKFNVINGCASFAKCCSTAVWHLTVHRFLMLNFDTYLLIQKKTPEASEVGSQRSQFVSEAVSESLQLCSQLCELLGRCSC